MTKAVRITGHEEVRKAIRQIGNEMDRNAAKGALKKMNLEAAELVKTVADGLVPVQTGKLAATVRAAGSQKSARVRAGYQRVPYAGPIHFGWPDRGIRPQPFLYEALDQRRSKVIDLYDDRLAKLIKEYRLD